MLWLRISSWALHFSKINLHFLFIIFNYYFAHTKTNAPDTPLPTEVDQRTSSRWSLPLLLEGIAHTVYHSKHNRFLKLQFWDMLHTLWKRRRNLIVVLEQLLPTANDPGNYVFKLPPSECNWCVSFTSLIIISTVFFHLALHYYKMFQLFIQPVYTNAYPVFSGAFYLLFGFESGHFTTTKG